MELFHFPMGAALVKGVEITKHFATGGNRQTPLNQLNFEIQKGETLALFGRSGSGKTTLLNIIGLLEAPSAGKLFLEGKDTSKFSERERNHFRANKIGFIFQTFNLIPTLTAVENVEYALTITGHSGTRARKKAAVALAEVGLEKVMNHKPSQLSGGQRQRVAIARALVKEPLLILADEPTANLDSQNATHILSLLADLNKKFGVTVVYASHDPLVLAATSRRIMLDQAPASLLPSVEVGVNRVA